MNIFTAILPFIVIFCVLIQIGLTIWMGVIMWKYWKEVEK